MAALTSGSFTIAYLNADRRTDTGMTDRIRYVGLKLTLASGTAPTALKLPSFQSVGLVRRLDKYIFDQPILIGSGKSGTAVSGPLLIRYQATGNTLAFFKFPKSQSATGTQTIGITPLATTINIKSQIIYTTAVGW